MVKKDEARNRVVSSLVASDTYEKLATRIDASSHHFTVSGVINQLLLISTWLRVDDFEIMMKIKPEDLLPLLANSLRQLQRSVDD